MTLHFMRGIRQESVCVSVCVCVYVFSINLQWAEIAKGTTPMPP